VLVHVEAFDNTSRAYTRLSVSTKIPQYMAAGRPILCYGPAEVASCRYVEATRSGVVVGERDKVRLLDGLRLLCENGQARKEFGQDAWRAARDSHDVSQVSAEFRAVLASAAWDGTSRRVTEHTESSRDGRSR
jgi:hypothetical protein